MSFVAVATPTIEEEGQLARSILNASNPVEAIGNISDIMDVVDLNIFVSVSRYHLENQGDNAPAAFLRGIDILLLHNLTVIEIERRQRSREAFNRYLTEMRWNSMLHMIDNSDLVNAHRTIYGWIEEFRRRL